jgi:hypothetical protein
MNERVMPGLYPIGGPLITASEGEMMRIGPLIGSLCIENWRFYTFQEASDKETENIYQQTLAFLDYNDYICTIK